MSLIEAITRAYFPISYMFETKESYNFLFVSKEFYKLFHNNGFLQKINLDGFKYDYMELINQLFSQLHYATKMKVSNFKNPHNLKLYHNNMDRVQLLYISITNILSIK